MNKYEARWNTAKALAQAVAVYVNDSTYFVTYQGEEVGASNLKINEYSVWVQHGNSSCFVFVNDRDLDEGSHWEKDEIIRRFKDGFKVYVRKEVKWI